MAKTALIIGGGVIGVTTAWYLAERGIAVTLVERRAACGLETSYANGGLITPSQSDPWNGPGTLTHLLTWLGRDDSPLLLRPRALPGIWAWGLRFLWASRAAPWWRATEANLRLGLYSVSCLTAIRETLKLEYAGSSAGTLKLFRDGYALERSATLAESLAAAGLRYSVLSPEQAVDLEPLLEGCRGGLAGAIHYPLDQSGDAHAFTQALESKAAKAGVRMLFGTEVQSFVVESGSIAAVHTSGGELIADSYVLAAGCASPKLAAPLAIKLPMYPVKGYSLTLAMPGRRLGVPLVDFERKIVLTPLGKRLRIAGTAEFSGFDLGSNPRRAAAILEHARHVLPALGAATAGEPWVGLRPMTADGPPILGATPYPNLYLNTGHGPLGWTLAAGSARVVADLVAGHAPEIELTGLDYARYRP